jgi:hypothetical protein
MTPPPWFVVLWKPFLVTAAFVMFWWACVR